MHLGLESLLVLRNTLCSITETHWENGSIKLEYFSNHLTRLPTSFCSFSSSFLYSTNIYESSTECHPLFQALWI